MGGGRCVEAGPEPPFIRTPIYVGFAPEFSI